MVAALVATVAGASVIAGSSGGGNAGHSAGGPARAAATGSATDQFAALSAAHSNQCQLQAAQVMAMSKQDRLQGSCCFPMDETSYRSQLRGLREYASLRRLVPSNPYDVSVGVTQRLLGYRSIPLTAREHTAYDVAVRRSDTHGPCCCACWRAQAFRGQAHYLLHRRRFSGAQVGRLWSLEEGCGGPPESKT